MLFRNTALAFAVSTAFVVQTSAFTMSPASRTSVGGMRAPTGVIGKKSFELRNLLSPEFDEFFAEKKVEFAAAMAVLKMKSSTYEEDLVNPDVWNYAPPMDWEKFFGK